MGISEAEVRAWAGGMRDSDPEAATELFHAFYPHLFRYARRITRDEGTAEDVVQEAFLRLWKMRARLDPDRSVRALLFVTVRNLAYNTQDARTRPLQGSERRRVRDADPSERTNTDMLSERLKVWIDALPDRRREAFHLSRYEGLSYEEIARVMEISVKTVENHIRLALKDLRDQIRNYEPNLLKK